MKYLWIVLAFVLVGCGNVPLPWSCKAQSRDFMQQMQPVWTEWTDAVTLASQTPRMALSPQIATLQGIRRKADAIAVPECAKDIKTHYIASMDATLQGFLGFLGQQPESTTTVFFSMAGREAEAAATAIAALK